MRAEMTLFHRVGVWVDVERIVRTGLHARVTPDAFRPIEVDDAIGTALQGRHRTNGHTGGIFALIAAQHREMPACMGEAPLFDVFYPGAKGPQRHVVLRLARNGTGVTPDTRGVIEDKTEIRHSYGRLRAAIA
jgi:hypothetical protein